LATEFSKKRRIIAIVQIEHAAAGVKAI
jgi:hypothetical protein